MIYSPATALLLTIAMVVILKPVAQNVGLLDVPSIRKRHEGAIPLIGGIAMYIALLCSCLCFPLWREHDGIFLILLSFPILLIGIADDRIRVPVRWRFLVEICCCLIATVYYGVHLRTLGELLPGMDIQLGLMSIPLTIFGMVGVMNAYNMVDGVDGLSGGLAIMTFSSLAALAAFSDMALAFQIFTVAAALLGFLIFNYRFPGRLCASVFMGDAGTMLIGFILAWYLIRLSQGESAAITPASALWFFPIPLLDTVTVMLRRIMRGSSPFKADRGHLHHIMLRNGDGVNSAVLKIYGLQATGICYALVSIFLDIPQWFSFWLFITIFVLYFTVMTLALSSVRLQE